MIKEPCNRCKKEFNPRLLFQWIDGLDDLSPKLCRRCYHWVLDNWEDGDDLESMSGGEN